MNRRKFINNSMLSVAGLSAMSVTGMSSKLIFPLTNSPFFKLSLAQWSLHKEIFEGKMSPYDFASTAKGLGFEGLEYVSQLYLDVVKANDRGPALKNFIEKSNQAAAENEMNNLLIMIDGEGDLATSDEVERKKAVENHHQWIETAAAMNCHSIRVNLFGTNDEEKWCVNSAKSLTALGEYGAKYNVNILVENHGYLSSNAALLMKVLNDVNLDNCGTLPDFGNFCLKREDNKRWGANCVTEYDRYQGVKEMLPRAFAISAKSNDFDDKGNEIHTDYRKMLKMIKDHGFVGYIGVEFEGSVSEIEGIKATRDLLLNVAKELS